MSLEGQQERYWDPHWVGVTVVICYWKCACFKDVYFWTCTNQEPI